MRPETTVLFLIDGLRHRDHQTPCRIMPELGFRSVEASLFTGEPLSVHQQWTDYEHTESSPFLPVCRTPGLAAIWDCCPRPARRYMNFLIYRLSSLIHGMVLPRSSMIPPGFLCRSRPTQDRCPDSSRAYGEIESLFDLLRDQGRSWLYLAPPKMGFLGARDEKVESRFYASLSSGVRDFYYIKFGDLDGISHAFGPDSSQARRCIVRTKRRIRAICSALSRRSSHLRWILLSDHGFLPVTSLIPLPTWLPGALAEGTLQHYFVDSTLLRLWLNRPSERDNIIQELHTWGGGDLLSEETRERLGLAWGSPQLGHIVCVAPHGAIFWPDFFSAKAPVGMHGYQPHPDLVSPIETHGLGPLPSEMDHVFVGRWLKEVLRDS